MVALVDSVNSVVDVANFVTSEVGLSSINGPTGINKGAATVDAKDQVFVPNALKQGIYEEQALR
jgi:hypothetical protein